MAAAMLVASTVPALKSLQDKQSKESPIRSVANNNEEEEEEDNEEKRLDLIDHLRRPPAAR